MHEIISRRTAVKNGFSANDGDGQSLQKLGYVLRQIYNVVVHAGKNGNFDKLMRFERVRKRF
jgi:hypothetical protein